MEGLSEVFKCAEALVKRAVQETENEEHKGRSETTEGMSNRTFSNNKPIQSDVTEGDKMLRESLDRVNELQRIRTCRSMQQDVLREVGVNEGEIWMCFNAPIFKQIYAFSCT